MTHHVLLGGKRSTSVWLPFSRGVKQTKTCWTSQQQTGSSSQLVRIGASEAVVQKCEDEFFIGLWLFISVGGGDFSTSSSGQRHITQGDCTFTDQLDCVDCNEAVVRNGAQV